MIHKDAGTGRIRETGVEGMCKELRWERRMKATMEGNNVRLEGGEGNADIMEEGRGECANVGRKDVSGKIAEERKKNRIR